METEPDSHMLTQLIIILILTLLNALFAASEMAIVSVNKSRIKILADDGDKKAKLLLKMTDEPSKLLATIQVGITLAGFFSSASAATGIADDFAYFLNQLNVPYSKQIAVIAITIILSFIMLVFGELFPKRVALQKSEVIAIKTVRIIQFVSKIAMPFVKLLSATTNLLVKLIGFDQESEERVSKEEIQMLVETGQEHGVINETEMEMINSIIEFDNKLAGEIMTPRTEVFLINIATPVKEIISELLEERYSRIPVYEEDHDNIIGILFLKDFFAEAYKNGFENVDIRKILHVPYFVPETKNVDELFKDLQSSHIHMAILIDEYGGFSGIVTIEDLIEEVMGNIADEFDDDEPEIKKLDNNTYLVSGLMPIDELNDYLDLDLHSEHSDTIAGFIIDLLGSIPQSGDEQSIDYENITFKIEEVKEKRIEKIKVFIEK